MSPDEIEKLASRIGPLPEEYRSFLASYPDTWRRPMFQGAAPLAALVPDDVERIVALNEAEPAWVRREYVVIGGNGVGDPFLVKCNGEPGVFVGDHETGHAALVQIESTLSRFVAAHEGEHLDWLRDRCAADGLAEEALRLADAAVAAWKRYGKGKRATSAARARTSLKKLVDPATNEPELRRLLGAEPPDAATALASAMNVSPALAEEILEAKMFGRQRAVAYSALWRALPRRELAPWALRRSAERRRSPEELFWLDWSLQRAGVDRATRDALYAWLPDVPADIWADIETGDGRRTQWVDLPIEPGVAYPFGDDETGAHQPRTAVVFACALRMTRTLITESQFAPFRAAFAEPAKAWREVGPREPASVGLLDAIAYARWLEVKGGLVGARLPTEEEWETACRAGAWWRDVDFPDDLDEVAWSNLAWDARVVVARKAANPWGLYDVTGLAAEWTLSPYEMDHLRKPRPARASFDPAAVDAVPSYVPDYQTTCGGTLRRDLRMGTPSYRSGSQLRSGLDPMNAFRLVVPLRHSRRPEPSGQRVGEP